MHSKTVSLPGAQHACANRTQTSNKNRIKGNTNCHLPLSRFYSDSKHVINRIHKHKTHSKDTLANETNLYDDNIVYRFQSSNTIRYTKSRHKNKHQLHVWAMCPLRLCKLIVVCVLSQAFVTFDCLQVKLVAFDHRRVVAGVDLGVNAWQKQRNAARSTATP